MNLQYLFPCFFGIKKCKVNVQDLLDFCYSYDMLNNNKVSNVGGFQSNDLSFNDSRIKNLVNLILLESNELCSQLGINNKLELSNLWFNINQKGHYNNVHSHSGFLSGVFYAKTSKNSGDIVFRNPSQLHSYFMKDVNTEKYHPAIANEWFFTPESGDLFLFPSYLEHYVLVNNDNEDRISFAFNVNLLKD